ncbi:zinc finger, CCHC-type containing protein [Tanacetum coccineum]
MSSDKRSSFMSCLILSTHLSLGLPLLLKPSTTRSSTLLTSADYGSSLECPNHLNKSFSLILLISSRLKVVASIDTIWINVKRKLNIVNDIGKLAFMSTFKLNDLIIWHARLGYVHYKRMQDMSKDELIPAFDMDTKNDLCDLHATPSLGNKKYFVTFIDNASRDQSQGEKGSECNLSGYAEHSKDLVHETKSRIPNRTEYIGQFHRPKESLKEDDPKTFKKYEKSQDVAFWKESINDDMDSIMGNNTWVLADLPPGCKHLGYKWIFKRKLKVDGTIKKFKASTIRLLIAMASIHNLIIHQMDVKTTFLNGELDEEVYMNQLQGFIMPSNENKVDLTKELLSSSFSMKDMGEANVILGIRIKHKINGIAVSQSHYIEKVLKKFNYFDCTPWKLRQVPSNPNCWKGYTYASWIRNSNDNSSTSGWVFLLGGGAISWAYKKQTCITGSTMEFEFVAG